LVVCVTVVHLASGSFRYCYVNELTGKFPDQKSRCVKKNSESVVWLIFPIGRFVSGTVSSKTERISLLLLSFIELEFYPSGDNCVIAYTRL